MLTCACLPRSTRLRPSAEPELRACRRHLRGRSADHERRLYGSTGGGLSGTMVNACSVHQSELFTFCTWSCAQPTSSNSPLTTCTSGAIVRR
jgi:hypothetical protein